MVCKFCVRDSLSVANAPNLLSSGNAFNFSCLLDAAIAAIRESYLWHNPQQRFGSKKPIKAFYYQYLGMEKKTMTAAPHEFRVETAYR